MNKSKLRAYARMIARKGVNIQPGQEVFIDAGLDQPEFVRMLVEECYKCKAKSVVVDWQYQPLTKLHYRYQSLKTLSTLPDYRESKLKHKADVLACQIRLMSEDPAGLKGINQEKFGKSQQKLGAVIKPYRDAMMNKYQWCIAAVPGKEWAKRLFPELRVNQAVEKLWEAILDTSRVWDDPVAEWQRHNASLKEHCAALDAMGIEKLHYSSSNGTDFTVGLNPKGRFLGGSHHTLEGLEYFPNIPTEECFTSPLKGKAEGIVYGTKPICSNGQLIEGFWIRFHEGKAVEWHADKNEELLTKLITMDEGSAYLGEVALVPYASPISESGLLFYNTLFDENAACHLAIGMGFAETVEGFDTMPIEEARRALGVNDSIMHQDFMIGAKDTNIDAICRDGQIRPVFRDGNWAF